jgi:hypothetical protein
VADLTTLFVTYCATLYDTNVGATADNKTDLTTLIAKDLPTVRAASDGGALETTDVDDANTMYMTYLD